MNDTLMLHCGDYFSFNFLPSIDGKTIYKLQDNDLVYFGLLDNRQPFSKALLKKKFTKADQDSEGFIKIVLDSKDTLDLLAGTYYYSIKLRLLDSNFKIDKTVGVINKSRLILLA